jgi:DNA-binding NarL/FixJ family response regulator
MARRPLSRAWTPEDTASLAKLLREGKDYHQIARKMKRSFQTVRLYAKRAPQPERRPGERS